MPRRTVKLGYCKGAGEIVQVTCRVVESTPPWPQPEQALSVNGLRPVQAGGTIIRVHAPDTRNKASSADAAHRAHAPAAEAAPMNLVFDFAGVLFHWQPHEIVSAVLPALAPTRASADRLVADIFQGHGGDWSEFDRGTLTAGVLAQRVAQRVPPLSAAQARAVIDAVPLALVPIDASVALLQRLHARGHALYFLSNMPEPYARHLEAAHDFLRLFRRGVFSARAKMIKPEPAIFAHAAEAFGVEPAQTLFIDDMAVNVAAAQAAGWQAHHFVDADRCEAELARRALL